MTSKTLFQLGPLPMQNRTYKRLLLVGIMFTLVNLAGEFLYIYETRHYIRNFYPELYEGFRGSLYQRLRRGKHEENASPNQQIEVYKLLKDHIPGDKQVVVFVGDSLTERFEWSEYFSDLKEILVIKRGIQGDTVGALMDRFDVTFLPELYPKIFIMIGVNNIELKDICENGGFLNDYYALLDRLLASNILPANVYVQSILPVRREEKSNDIIRHCNQYIQQYCEKKGMNYIDIHTALSDRSGRLDLKYSIDGIHLTATGYNIWASIVRKYLTN